MNKCECGETNVIMKKKGNHIGLYCSECLKWLKWIPKKDVDLYKIKYHITKIY